MNIAKESGFDVQELSVHDTEVITLVALRMRATLVEVLGSTGRDLYTLEWLIDRVKWHLDREQCLGSVYLARSKQGQIVGHLICRIELGEGSSRLGLISTIYVVPERRSQGAASLLLDIAERWLSEQTPESLATDTAISNAKLIRLFESRGYLVSYRSVEKQMLRLSRRVTHTAEDSLP